MQLEKVFELQAHFLERYPQGFNDPEIMKIAKKHNVPKCTELAQSAFAPEQFALSGPVIENMIKLVAKSSMVSLFEKPRFRDDVRAMLPDEQLALSQSLQMMLHGDQEQGFEQMVGQLAPLKLAKWSLLSLFPFYYAPTDNWFIKPNTTKAVLNYFRAEDLIYKPRPGYAFYRDYSNMLDQLKDMTDPALSPSNAAFTGFLMMTIM